MRRAGSVFVAAAVVLSTLVCVKGGEAGCSYYWGESCKSPHTGLVWKEVKDGQAQVLCCKQEHKDYETWKSKATQCRDTKCVPRSSLDGGSGTCGSLPPRYVNGKQLSYEEIASEPCSGGSGLAGLCCIKDSLEGRLATTLGAEPNEFPHIVKLQLPAHCGGTIYNKKYILTAAHCITDDKGNTDPESEMNVILGSNIGNSEQYVIKVAKAIPHSKYSRSAGHPEFAKNHSLIFNDIALLELEEEITFGPNVKSIQLAPVGFKAEDYADNAVIAGWGTTETMQISENLQKANFIIRDDQACFFYNYTTKAWGPHAQYEDYEGLELEKQLICFGGILNGRYSHIAGKGDSGGPAICRGPEGKIVLCGVTSFGAVMADCVRDKNETCRPSVYAEVGNPEFQKWIKDNAGEQDPATFYQPYLYGEPIQDDRFGHQVHISSGNGKPCGGTLIAPDVVVTAAQCVYDSSGKARNSIEVMSGIKDLKGSNGKMHSVTNMVKRKGFKMVGKPVNVKTQGNRVRLTDNYYNDDLALLKLNQPANISPKQLPELPESRLETGTELAFPRDTKYSSKLMARDFKILEQGQCQRRMDRLASAGANIKVDRNLLCGVEKYSGGSTCDRELGGGLICKGRNGKDQLCGVQVFRLCESSIPNGFMDMSYYKDWLELEMPKL